MWKIGASSRRARSLALVILIASCADPQTGTDIVFLSRRVSPPLFTVKHLQDLGEQERGIHPGLLSLWFTTSDSDSRELFTGLVSMGGRQYREWRTDHDALASRKWKVGRYLAWGGSAVLQMRNEDGAISRKVLKGDDFLRTSSGVDIVGLSKRGSGQSVELILLGRVDGRLDVSAAKSVLERFSSLGVATIRVDMRKDPWFIENVYAPPFDPFGPNLPIPSESEARKLPQLSCVARVDVRTPDCLCEVGNRPQKDLERCAH